MGPYMAMGPMGASGHMHTSSQGQVDGRPDCANQPDGQLDTTKKHWKQVSVNNGEVDEKCIILDPQSVHNLRF